MTQCLGLSCDIKLTCIIAIDPVWMILRALLITQQGQQIIDIKLANNILIQLKLMLNY